MRTTILDIETDGLDPTRIWCVVTKELKEEPKVWLEGDYVDLVEYLKECDRIVAHNGLTFDIPVLNRLIDAEVPHEKVVDTFVCSRLINYSRFRTHSLAELGTHLGEPKGDFHDWMNFSQEMVDYCIQDVRVNEKIYLMYLKYIDSPDWQDSLKLEHDIVAICEDMSANGFLFNKDRAQELLTEITYRKSILEGEFQEIWPPRLEVVNTIQYRIKGDGTPYKNVAEAMARYPKTKLEGTDLLCYDYVSFNPGSTKDRVTKLWEAGWQPVTKTKTHQEFTRDGRVGEYWRKTKLTQALYDEKKEHFAFYGWVVDETNLNTLPDSAPEGAKKLAEWLTLEGRRSSLAEWLGCVKEDNRIHGKFWHIGAWTHRMSHSNPNQANIFSPFHGDIRSPVDRVKHDYDYELRALWQTDKVLVGTDADGIQLRILAHYMESEEYREAILNGRKEDATDIHNLNKRALGVPHITRDHAKTFIYAWLLGAGTGKVASILGTNTKQAKGAVDQFLDSLPGLGRLKRGRIVHDARRGYFTGLDGRKVLCNNEHLMLAGYLQNGEAIAMKRWCREWQQQAKRVGLWFRQVDFVHDEVQVEVNTKEDAKELIMIQQAAMTKVSDDLGLFCPLSVSGDIGYNWAETH